MTILKLLLFLPICLSVYNMSYAQAYTYSYIERADSADRYIRQERWEDAERNLKAALRLEPGNPGNALLLSNLGFVQTQLDRPEEAIESYTVSLSIAPRSAVVLSNRGMAYMQLGQNKEALADFDSSLAIDSMRSMPLRWRGLLRLETGDVSGARHDLTRLSTIDPKDPLAFEGLARCDIAEGSLQKAITHIEQAITLAPSPERYFLKASAEMDTALLPEAAETLRTAIKEYPRYGNLYLLRARLHQLNYRPTDAEIDRKTAMANGADPDMATQLLERKKQ